MNKKDTWIISWVKTYLRLKSCCSKWKWLLVKSCWAVCSLVTSAWGQLVCWMRWVLLYMLNEDNGRWKNVLDIRKLFVNFCAFLLISEKLFYQQLNCWYTTQERRRWKGSLQSCDKVRVAAVEEDVFAMTFWPGCWCCGSMTSSLIDVCPGTWKLIWNSLHLFEEADGSLFSSRYLQSFV